MNKTFIVLALLVTFGYIIYYAVTIARDIVKSKKTKGGEVESFEVGGEVEDGESTPKYIGEDGESYNPNDDTNKDPDVDNQPHSDINEQVGNDQQSGGGGQHRDVEPEPETVEVNSPKNNYRQVLGYAKEVALATPVKPEFEDMLESEDYLEEMFGEINNESEIKYKITKF